MKTWIILTIAVLVVVAMLVPAAFAQGPANNGMNFNETPLMSGPYGAGNGPGYVDSDGDGQCDNFVDEDGDGVCDLAGTGQGNGQGTGPGYVDNDGDGVCDYAGTGQGQQGRHGQRGQGMRGSWAN